MIKIIPLLIALVGCQPAPEPQNLFERSCKVPITQSVIWLDNNTPKLIQHCSEPMVIMEAIS